MFTFTETRCLRGWWQKCSDAKKYKCHDQLSNSSNTAVQSNTGLKHGSDCEWVVVAARRSFNVQVCEHQPNLVTLRDTEVPLLLQVWRIRLWILWGPDLSVHYWLWVLQRPALTHRHTEYPGKVHEKSSICLSFCVHLSCRSKVDANREEQTQWHNTTMEAI